MGAPLLGALLFGIGPQDPATLALVGAVLLSASALAALVPSQAAGRIDPAGPRAR